MAQITQIITIHDYNKMTDEQKAALSENNMLAVVQQDWQQVRIDAAVKLTCALSEKMLGAGYSERQIVKQAVELTDTLVAELKHNDDVYAECRRMDAINTAAMCENMTKIQKELQMKGGNNEPTNPTTTHRPA